ncbi:uncharacterized protein LOC142321234 [Lycorma delicatula]|uniref:uncharacterized protein LOC142321234 n=1 Tax=Lycorma delicatula TaxID=130591 RepID=UPI003F516596
MDMVKSFYGITVDRTGKKILKTETENYRVFTNKYEKINNYEYLNIYKDKPFFKEHFGEYPVMYLDFKLLRGEDWENFIISFRYMVKDTYSYHRYLTEAGCLNEKEANIFNRYCFLDRNVSLNLVDLERDMLISLNFLSNYLHLYFNRNVIVLIDDYDAPIQRSIFNAGKDLQKIISFIKEFFSKFLNSNQHIERALLNACVRQAVVSTIEVNNTNHFFFNEQHPFNKYYGLTENEVKGLTEKLNISNSLARIRKWYEGYNIPNTGVKLYNVHSIVHYLCFRVFKNYWVMSSYIPNLKYIFLNNNIRVKTGNLFKYKAIQIKTTDKINFTEAIMLSKLVNNRKYGMSAPEESVFLNFLLDLGYLTATMIKDNKVTVKLPNKEIRDELRKEVFSMEYYMRKFHLTDDVVREYVSSILALGESGTSYEKLGKCVLKSFIRFDLTDQEAEVQEAMLFFLRYYLEFRIVRSQTRVIVKDVTRSSLKTSNTKKNVAVYDYIDLLIVRKDYTGIVLHFNYFNKDSKSNFSLYTGLEQIINKGYFKALDYLRNIHNKIYVGLAVKQKDSETGKPQCIISVLYNSLNLKDNKTCIIV